MVELISKLVVGEDLSEDEAASAMAAIMSGEATQVQVAGFLVALRIKGVTVDELTGFARTVRAMATPIAIRSDGLLDTCGTGGDSKGTINISTLAALVAAGAGARVAKHGNRAASSRCGSADVLEALGVRIDMGPEEVASCIEETGIGFLFAPLFHPAFRHAGPVRKELGVRTVFNLLGPLCHPAAASYQAMGVGEAGAAGKLAATLARLGVDRALVFTGSDGMDELTLTGPSQVVEIVAGERTEYEVDPVELGLARAPLEAIEGGTPEQNARVVREILAGATGPRRDVVLLNSAAALRAAGLVGDWREGIGLAAEVVDRGDAGAVLDRWVKVGQAVS